MSTYYAGHRDFEAMLSSVDPNSQPEHDKPDRNRRTLAVWLTLAAVLAVCIIAMFLTGGISDASAAGGCGGG